METEDILKVLTWLTTNAPQLALFALTVLVVLMLLTIVKMWRADEGVAFRWGKLELGRWSHAKLSKKLEQSLRELNVVSRKQGQVIQSAKKLASDMAYAFSGENPERPELAIRALVAFIVAAIPSIMSADGTHRCAVLVPTEDGTELKVHTGFGYRRESEAKLRLPIPRSDAGTAYHTRAPLYDEDILKNPRWVKLPDQRHNYRSILCVPIVAGNQCFGVLNVDAVEPNAFTADDQTYLELFAHHLASLLAMESGIQSVLEEGSSHAESAAGRSSQ